MVLQSINPATEDVLQTFEEFSDAQIDEALQQAHDARLPARELVFADALPSVVGRFIERQMSAITESRERGVDAAGARDLCTK